MNKELTKLQNKTDAKLIEKLRQEKQKAKKNTVLLAITVIACSILIWHNNIEMYKELRRDHSKAIVIYQIIEQRHADAVSNSEDAEQSVSDDEGASSDVSLDGGEEALSSSSHREVEMSAYTSRVEETDSSPCISASGDNICEYDGCVVAYNALPLGSKVNVEGFGECTVLDRMNARYGENNMDIYFGMDLDGALNFGRRNVNIEVLS